MYFPQKTIPIAIILLACVSSFCQAQEDGGPDYYTAAVFEHRHRHNITVDSKNEVKRKNLNFFKRAAAVAAEKGADIIVFQEYGTFPYKPDRAEFREFGEYVPDTAERNFNPCEEKSKFADSLILVTLSCLAKRHKIYVVANMADKQPCDLTSDTCDLDDMKDCDMNESQCPEDGVFLYNTDVAFNREGYLIARYHKVHPYFEIVNVPEVPEYSFFKTEFGVFGLIVCFDCIFKESVQLVEKYGLDTLVFPTFWFDDISPLNAIELQQAWALSNNVNFLAANGHLPNMGTLGSGIYSKYFGALKYSYNPDGESKLLIAKVPRSKNQQLSDEKVTRVILITDDGVRDSDDTGENFPEQCYVKIMGNATDRLEYRCFKEQLAHYSLEKLKSSSGTVQKCQNGMCCSVSYSAESMEEEYYLAVFNGTNDVKDYYYWCEESCLLVRCDPFENRPCAVLPSISTTVFHSVEMTARFTAQRIYPTVSKTKQRLAPKSEWDFETAKNRATLRFRSESSVPLLKLGLVGRCYDRDPPFKPWH